MVNIFSTAEKLWVWTLENFQNEYKSAHWRKTRMAFLSLNLHEFPQFTIVVRRKEPQGSSSVIHFFYKQSAKTNYKKSARRPSPVKVFEVLRFPIRAFKLCSSHWWQLHQKMQTPINSLCSRNFTECLMSSSFLSIWQTDLKP